jgi:ribonuclease P protein component
VLAAHQRLRRADDFATVIRRGRRAGRNGLVVHLHTRELDAPAEPRAGFVVPKAVGPAVTRNTLRRRLRHLLRDELPRLAPGTDLVVRVLPEAADRSFAELGGHLRSAIEAARRPRSGTRGGGRGGRTDG